MHTVGTQQQSRTARGRPTERIDAESAIRAADEGNKSIQAKTPGVASVPSSPRAANSLRRLWSTARWRNLTPHLLIESRIANISRHDPVGFNRNQRQRRARITAARLAHRAADALAYRPEHGRPLFR